jgi:hypothetical protein
LSHPTCWEVGIRGVYQHNLSVNPKVSKIKKVLFDLIFGRAVV